MCSVYCSRCSGKHGKPEGGLPKHGQLLEGAFDVAPSMMYSFSSLVDDPCASTHLGQLQPIVGQHWLTHGHQCPDLDKLPEQPCSNFREHQARRGNFQKYKEHSYSLPSISLCNYRPLCGRRHRYTCTCIHNSLSHQRLRMGKERTERRRVTHAHGQGRHADEDTPSVRPPPSRSAASALHDGDIRHAWPQNDWRPSPASYPPIL